jgi:integrase
MLDTAARPGELLSLQWKDVNLERHELVFRAEKTKTRTERIVPISTRLLGMLEMRKLDPAGEPLPPDAYVFGDALGRKVKSVRTAWENACERAGLTGVQLRDLRHEAGSRFEEAGVALTVVSKILGHTNLTTTSRYLNIHRRGLHAVRWRSWSSTAPPLHNKQKDAQAGVPSSDTSAPVETSRLQ